MCPPRTTWRTLIQRLTIFVFCSLPICTIPTILEESVAWIQICSGGFQGFFFYFFKLDMRERSHKILFIFLVLPGELLFCSSAVCLNCSFECVTHTGLWMTSNFEGKKQPLAQITRLTHSLPLSPGQLTWQSCALVHIVPVPDKASVVDKISQTFFQPEQEEQQAFPFKIVLWKLYTWLFYLCWIRLYICCYFTLCVCVFFFLSFLAKTVLAGHPNKVSILQSLHADILIFIYKPVFPEMYLKSW